MKGASSALVHCNILNVKGGVYHVRPREPDSRKNIACDCLTMKVHEKRLLVQIRGNKSRSNWNYSNLYRLNLKPFLPKSNRD